MAKKSIDEDERQTLDEDLAVVDSSLHFISDLMRNILDSHRASSDLMTLNLETIGLKDDIFQPVASIIYNRDGNFRVDIDCASDLLVRSDKLRLQQLVLNLAKNSSKFVTEGFIRLRAEIVNGSVCIFIEDSGPGIPVEKQDRLFARYQRSLDTLAQGTGMGLYLCKKLVDVMEGSIYLDASYNSGIVNFPGTRFVIDLKQGPVRRNQNSLKSVKEGAQPTRSLSDSSAMSSPNLPQNPSILLVDDSRILRKQASRAIQRILPEAEIQEAASGETALQAVDEMNFDVIFMDQYMESVEQSLLGTETVRAMRVKGVTSKICGLSANQMRDNFVAAGADSFLLKPFPCKEEELLPVLMELLVDDNTGNNNRPEAALDNGDDDIV